MVFSSRFFRAALIVALALLLALPALCNDVLITPGRSNFIELNRGAFWATSGRTGTDNAYVLVPPDPDLPGCVQVINRGAGTHNVIVNAYGTWDTRVTAYETNPNAWTLLSAGTLASKSIAATRTGFWRVPPTGGARLAVRVYNSDGSASETADILLNFSKVGMCGDVAYSGTSVVGGAFEGDKIPSATTSIQPVLVGGRYYDGLASSYRQGVTRQSSAGAMWTSGGCGYGNSNLGDQGPFYYNSAGGVVMGGSSSAGCLQRVVCSNLVTATNVITVGDGVQTTLSFTIPAGDTKVYDNLGVKIAAGSTITVTMASAATMGLLCHFRFE